MEWAKGFVLYNSFGLAEKEKFTIKFGSKKLSITALHFCVVAINFDVKQKTLARPQDSKNRVAKCV